MRYDKRIVYFDSKKAEQDSYFANVTEVSAEKISNMFPDIKEQIVIFRIGRPLEYRSGWFKIDEKYYKIVKSQRLRNASTFYGAEHRGEL
ncbi:hypothetical protein [Enterococcus sp. AZ126]|uniref:hypothetical protein n=1 Tax=Enterococcus sp. AZ126 TaxID=2774635 RepID=UPI003F257687